MFGCGGCCTEDQSGDVVLAAPVTQADAVRISQQPAAASGRGGGEAAAATATPDFMGKIGKAQPEEEEIPDKLEFMAHLPVVKGEYPGIGLDMSEGAYLRISKVDRKGLVADYNNAAQPGEKMKDGHFIVSVNGLKGEGRKMMQALFSGPCDVVLRRPSVISVGPLQKQGSSLGLDLTYQARSVSAVVKQVFENDLVDKWNKTAAVDQQIRPNDHILSVNGKTGGARQLVQAISDSSQVELLVSRPATM